MTRILAGAALTWSLTWTLAWTLTWTLTGALTVPAAAAWHPKAWMDQAIGQDVYNLTDRRIGRLDGYIDVRGTPGAIISIDGPGGGKIVAPADDLGKRHSLGSGLLLALSDASVMNMPKYEPGKLPYW